MHNTVFISYAGEDREKAQQIRAALRSSGIDAWMAPDDIQPGKDFPTEIQRAAETCRVLVLLVSRSSNKSRWVHSEVSMAWERRSDETPGAVVLPVLLEEGVKPDKGLEPFLRRRQWLFAERTPFASHLEKICASVEALLAGEDEPPPLNPALPAPEFEGYGEARRAAGLFRITAPAAWWTICGLLPLASLLCEYRSEGIFLAQISPHFFLFPVLIGFLIPYCLVAPTHFLVKRKKLDVRVLGLLLLFSAYVTYSDMASGDPMLAQYARILDLDLVDLREDESGLAHSLLVNRAASTDETANVVRRIPLLKEVHSILGDCPQLQLTGQSSYSGAGAQDCQNRRKRLRSAIAGWRDGPDKRLSVTGYLFIVSIFVQVFTVGLSVVSISFLFAMRGRNWEPHLNNFMTFIFFSYFLWLPFRVIALHEKANLYGEVNFLTELPITLVFLLSYALTISLAVKRQAVLLVYLLLSLVGCALLYVAIYYPSWLLHVIGRSSDPLTYPMITMAILIVVFPLVRDRRSAVEVQ